MFTNLVRVSDDTSSNSSVQSFNYHMFCLGNKYSFPEFTVASTLPGGLSVTSRLSVSLQDDNVHSSSLIRLLHLIKDASGCLHFWVTSLLFESSTKQLCVLSTQISCQHTKLPSQLPSVRLNVCSTCLDISYVKLTGWIWRCHLGMALSSSGNLVSKYCWSNNEAG